MPVLLEPEAVHAIPLHFHRFDNGVESSLLKIRIDLVGLQILVGAGRVEREDRLVVVPDVDHCLLQVVAPGALLSLRPLVSDAKAERRLWNVCLHLALQLHFAGLLLLDEVTPRLAGIAASLLMNTDLSCLFEVQIVNVAEERTLLEGSLVSLVRAVLLLDLDFALVLRNLLVEVPQPEYDAGLV